MTHDPNPYRDIDITIRRGISHPDGYRYVKEVLYTGNWSPDEDPVYNDFLRAEYKGKTEGKWQWSSAHDAREQNAAEQREHMSTLMGVAAHCNWKLKVSPSCRPINCGPCAKQQVFCIIALTTVNMLFVGTNACCHPQGICPRHEGEGYEKCKTVCDQLSHAEVDACNTALGAVQFPYSLKSFRGSVPADQFRVFLFGHTYACDKCKAHLKETIGTDEVTILESLQELRGHLDSFA